MLAQSSKLNYSAHFKFLLGDQTGKRTLGDVAGTRHCCIYCVFVCSCADDLFLSHFRIVLVSAPGQERRCGGGNITKVSLHGGGKNVGEYRPDPDISP